MNFIDFVVDAVVHLMDALKKSIAGEAASAKGKGVCRAEGALLPIEGKKPAGRRRLSPSGQ